MAKKINLALTVIRMIKVHKESTDESDFEIRADPEILKKRGRVQRISRQ